MIKQYLHQLCIVIILLFPAQAFSEEPDWDSYTQLLQTYVTTGIKNNITLNLVDYQGISRDKNWPDVLNKIASFDESSLVSKNEKLAFWINAYNILAIKVVLDHWPLNSIRDAGGLFSPVWKKEAAIVAGKMRSLHEIEHEILRRMSEPRIHFAIVCASVSCPDLNNRAYTASSLNNQLDMQAALFLNHRDKGLRMQRNRLHMSKIFDWFESDFESHGGVIRFLQTYRKDIMDNSKSTSYLDYDWSLNDKASAPAS